MSLKWYNGYSPAERRAITPKVAAAIASGALKPSCQCSMCGMVADKPWPFHSERYHDPIATYPVCSRCHYALHIRFGRPDFWRRYVAGLPAGWCQHLSLDPRSLTRPFDETYPDGLP